MGDILGYSTAFSEHQQKIVKAIGDPQKVYAIRGWIRDCRHFSAKAHEEAVSTLNSGGKVIDVKTQSPLSLQDVEQRFAERQEWTIRAERQNEEIAKKHGY